MSSELAQRARLSPGFVVLGLRLVEVAALALLLRPVLLALVGSGLSDRDIAGSSGLFLGDLLRAATFDLSIVPLSILAFLFLATKAPLELGWLYASALADDAEDPRRWLAFRWFFRIFTNAARLVTVAIGLAALRAGLDRSFYWLGALLVIFSATYAFVSSALLGWELHSASSTFASRDERPTYSATRQLPVVVSEALFGGAVLLMTIELEPSSTLSTLLRQAALFGSLLVRLRLLERSHG